MWREGRVNEVARYGYAFARAGHWLNPDSTASDSTGSDNELFTM